MSIDGSGRSHTEGGLFSNVQSPLWTQPSPRSQSGRREILWFGVLEELPVFATRFQLVGVSDRSLRRPFKSNDDYVSLRVRFGFTRAQNEMSGNAWTSSDRRGRENVTGSLSRSYPSGKAVNAQEVRDGLKKGENKAEAHEIRHKIYVADLSLHQPSTWRLLLCLPRAATRSATDRPVDSPAARRPGGIGRQSVRVL